MKYLVLIILPWLLTSINVSAASQTSEALKLASKWQKSDVKPILGDDGRVLFAYGMSQPHIVCAPLKLCDIALEPGELVNDVKVGDNARWVLDGAVVGTNETRIEHIIVKPKQAGLENTLFIATNRRAYSINLISHATQNMGKVGFTYNDRGTSLSGSNSTPSGLESLYKGRPSDLQVAQEVDVITDRDILGSNLNFSYRISGDSVSWTPVRVYDDGVKTFIDFDVKKIQSRELPALMIYDTDALGSMVNYRVQRGRYIVDGLFDQAGLVLGVGRKQAKVTIRRVAGQGAVDQPYRQ